MTARKNVKKNLRSRFNRRPLPPLNVEKAVIADPGMARVHQHAERLVEEVLAGDITAAAEFLKRIDHPGTLRAYAISLAAIAASAQLPDIEVNDVSPQTPEDGADDAVELR